MKKAQTGVIVVILLVAVVIVAVLILWNIIVPILEKKGEEAEEIKSLLGVRLEAREVVLFPTGAVKVSVERKAGKGEFNGVKFVFYDENGNSYSETKEEFIGELAVRKYDFNLNLGKIKSVSVAPVFGERIGFVSRTSEKILEVPSGLVSWWIFDDAEDEMNRNPGSLVGNGEINGELVLNGGYFETGNNNLSINDKLTISAWIKPNLKTGSIVKKGNNYDVNLIDKGEISFFSVKSYDSVKEGWNHVVVTVDWTGDKYATVHLNKDIAGGNIIIPSLNNENVLIGKDFNGEIDDVMIFNRALLPDEVNSLYNYQLR